MGTFYTVKQGGSRLVRGGTLTLRHLLGPLAGWDADAGVLGDSLTALTCQLQHLVNQDHWRASEPET